MLSWSWCSVAWKITWPSKSFTTFTRKNEKWEIRKVSGDKI